MQRKHEQLNKVAVNHFSLSDFSGTMKVDKGIYIYIYIYIQLGADKPFNMGYVIYRQQTFSLTSTCLQKSFYVNNQKSVISILFIFYYVPFADQIF